MSICYFNNNERRASLLFSVGLYVRAVKIINFAYGNAPYTAYDTLTLMIFKIPRSVLVSIVILSDKSAPFISTQLLLLEAITVRDRLFDSLIISMWKEFNIIIWDRSCFSHFDDKKLYEWKFWQAQKRAKLSPSYFRS